MTLPLVIAGQQVAPPDYDFDREYVSRSLHFWDDDWADSNFLLPQAPDKVQAEKTFKQLTPGSSASFRAADSATAVDTDDFVRQLLNHRGDEYEWGGTNEQTGYDCSGLIYSTMQAAGYTNFPRNSSAIYQHARPISLARALKTRGAVLWKEGHIAISLGNGKTIEAKGEDYGVGVFDATGRFTNGGILPELANVVRSKSNKEITKTVRQQSRTPGKRFRLESVDPSNLDLDDHTPMSTIPGVMMTLYGERRFQPQQRDKTTAPQGKVPDFVPDEYRTLVLRAARKYGLPTRLLALIIQKESGFNPDARSPAGALGMMQVMPQYHQLNDYFDAHENVMYGAKFLSDLIHRYDGNVRDALAFYNAGYNLEAGYGYADDLLDSWKGGN